MFGLLVELVADERAECQSDPERLRFIETLLAGLRTVEAKLPQLPAATAVQRLEGLHESADPEFSDDPVMVHLRDLIDELEDDQSF